MQDNCGSQDGVDAEFYSKLDHLFQDQTHGKDEKIDIGAWLEILRLLRDGGIS